MQELRQLIESATKNFTKTKRYISKGELNLFSRFKQLNKSDKEFLEELCLLHLKDIEGGQEVSRFYGLLDSFIFKSLLKKQFFTSFDLFRLLCYRIHLLPRRLLAWEVRRYSRGFLNDRLTRASIRGLDSIELLAKTPLREAEVEAHLAECKRLLALPIKVLVINPLNLALRLTFNGEKRLGAAWRQNLKTLLEKAGDKQIFFSHSLDCLGEILENLEICLGEVEKPPLIGLSLQAYRLDSMSALEDIASLSARLREKGGRGLLVRIMDMDYLYDKESFENLQSTQASKLFTNKTTALANFLALLAKYKELNQVLECSLKTSSLFIPGLLEAWGLDSKTSLEVEVGINRPLYKLARHRGLKTIAMGTYTRDFSSLLPLRLKAVSLELQRGIFDYIQSDKSKTEWKKRCQDFYKSLSIARKMIEEGGVAKVGVLTPHRTVKVAVDSEIFEVQPYNFESFDREVQRPFEEAGESFANLLESIPTSAPNPKRLERVLYLSASDAHRLAVSGITSATALFSLYADTEKEELVAAQNRREEIETNKINLMISIISHLKKQAASLVATLAQLDTSASLEALQAQAYLLIDIFKYYGYAYRRLVSETDSVLLSPLGAVLIHANGLTLSELAACIAANVMIGNVSLLSDSTNSRILIHLLAPMLEVCPFAALYDPASSLPIQKQILDKGRLDSAVGGQLLISNRGVLVVFISVFYDLHDALRALSRSRAIYDGALAIYTDSKDQDLFKEVFSPLTPTHLSFASFLRNLPRETAQVSLFTYNRREMQAALRLVKVSLSINASYVPMVVSGSPRVFCAGYAQPFLSRFLLQDLIIASPSSVIRKNSLYSEVISCFVGLLSADEVDFLYNLNHNYSQYLKPTKRESEQIHEIKRPYPLALRVYGKDDFFHVCVIMLVAYILDIPTRLSFVEGYFDSEDGQGRLEKLKASLQEKNLDLFNALIESEQSFLDSLQDSTLVRILREEAQFAIDFPSSYAFLRRHGLVAQYSLPILNKNLELERYLYTQYVFVNKNFLLDS